jgi:hypothetical protein
VIVVLPAPDGRFAPLFCYPYGGRETFDDQTESLLADHGIKAAFAVDPRPVSPSDFDRRFALPCFDCNMFPFGTASLGRNRAQGRDLRHPAPPRVTGRAHLITDEDRGCPAATACV